MTPTVESKKGLLIKAIIFDYGQTLVDAANGFRKAEKEAERRIFSHLGLASWEDFLFNYRKIRKEFHSRSEFSRASMWQALYKHYGVYDGSDLLKALEEEYWENVKKETRPFPETEEVLEELSSRYRLAVITNTQGQSGGREHRIRDFPDLERFFKVIIVAGESGIPPKPHPTAFAKCLEFLNMSNSQAVFVGDDWEIDICGAKEAGIQPIWIQHASVERSWPIVETSVPIINSLRSLLQLEQLVKDNQG
jgi:HAD superfamily hydrolase (TIGR01549 family)